MEWSMTYLEATSAQMMPPNKPMPTAELTILRQVQWFKNIHFKLGRWYLFHQYPSSLGILELQGQHVLTFHIYILLTLQPSDGNVSGSRNYPFLNGNNDKYDGNHEKHDNDNDDNNGKFWLPHFTKNSKGCNQVQDAWWASSQLPGSGMGIERRRTLAKKMMVIIGEDDNADKTISTTWI